MQRKGKKMHENLRKKQEDVDIEDLEKKQEYVDIEDLVHSGGVIRRKKTRPGSPYQSGPGSPSQNPKNLVRIKETSDSNTGFDTHALGSFFNSMNLRNRHIEIREEENTPPNNQKRNNLDSKLK